MRCTPREGAATDAILLNLPKQIRLPGPFGTDTPTSPHPEATRRALAYLHDRGAHFILLADKIARLNPDRRRRVEERAAELVAEEMTLRELRKARQLTQDGVSRLEQRSDLFLSTLRKTIEAMGGSLSLVARFPDRPPVELSGIADSAARD